MANAPTSVAVKKQVTTPDVWTSFRGEMDRLFDRFGVPSFPSFFGASPDLAFTVPAVDVTEDDKAYKIAAEMPGVEEKDIDVSVNEDTLVLKGEKRQEKEEKGKNTYVSERSYGSFQRAFALPEGVDRGKIAADFSKGVLTVTLPKTPESQKQQKKIEIKTH
ncbi:MAG: Hsp20/alpha crystallin family protein [Stellaceae bacterium]|jgi:HSP20 family protein